MKKVFIISLIVLFVGGCATSRRAMETTTETLVEAEKTITAKKDLIRQVLKMWPEVHEYIKGALQDHYERRTIAMKSQITILDEYAAKDPITDEELMYVAGTSHYLLMEGFREALEKFDIGGILGFLKGVF